MKVHNAAFEGRCLSKFLETEILCGHIALYFRQVLTVKAYAAAHAPAEAAFDAEMGHAMLR